MKLFSTSITILLFAALFVALPVHVFAVPGIPHQFYGTVTFSGTAAPDGLLVEARVGGETVGSASTFEGKYGYSPDLLFAVNDSAEWTGEEVASFVVGGITADQTKALSRGGYNELALTLTGSVGSVSVAEGESIENETIVVTPENPTLVSVGNDIDITISSDESTSATIAVVEKLTGDFFSGVMAVLGGNNVLNGFEINISGEGITISVTMTYDDAGIDESTVKPYRHNGVAWVLIEPFTRDSGANTLTFSILSAETPYSLFGESLAVADDDTPTDSGSGGGGGGGGSTTPPPTYKTGDANKDGKVDKYDFALMMSAWQTTGTNSSDLNGDNKVDKYDFALLMLNWSAI